MRFVALLLFAASVSAQDVEHFKVRSAVLSEFWGMTGDETAKIIRNRLPS